MTHTVQIGPLRVGPGQPVTLVAEVGINHNGNLDQIKMLAQHAKLYGWQMVKIQTRINRQGKLTDVYTPEELAKPREIPRDLLEMAIRRGVFSQEEARYLREQPERTTTHDQKRSIELLPHELSLFVAYANEVGVVPFSTPWCLGAVEVLEEAGVPCYKIGSPSAADDELLRAVAETGKPVILSTGMCTMEMVEHAVETLLKYTGDDKLVILHCTSVYEQPSAMAGDHNISLLNLRCIETFRQRFDPIPIGFSGNDTGIQPAYAAAVLGAVMIEKHVTLWRGMYGSDQASSIELDDMMRLARMVRELPAVIGDGVKRFYEAEYPVADKLRKAGTKRP